MTQSPIYQGPLLTVYQWQEALHNNEPITFECCVRPDTVAVIAFLDEHTILLNEERQPGHARPFLDVPGGRVDARESGVNAAQRELREETGYNAKRWMLWGTHEYRGLIRFQCLIYVAKDLRSVKPSADASHDPTENITTCVVPFTEAYQHSLRGELRRPEVMLALLQMKHDKASEERLTAFLSQTSTIKM